MNAIELSERNEKGKFYKDFLQIRSEILNDLEKDIKRREKRFWEALEIQLKKLEKTEFWKDIEGYEGLYQISSFGRVKSLKYGKERILKPLVDKDGYLLAILCKEGKTKNHKIHRLVASAFLPNPNNYPCINHKDENKQNNCVDNLEWCTVKYNINYGTRTEKCSKKVGQYDLKGKLIKTWKSIMEIERRTGFFRSNITACCRGYKNHKTAYNYYWQYL